MRLYFVRHGESTANLLREFSNQGHKHPLTENGIRQAQALADALAALHVDLIYSSPVLRAAQTAQILADSLHAPLEITEALREWDVGIYEGTSGPTGWELHRQVQEDWFVRRQWEHRMPSGESFNEIKQRFVPFIERLVEDEPRSNQTIVLVSHGGLYTAMLPIILKHVDFTLAARLGFPYASPVVAETGPDGLRCVSWGGQALDSKGRQ